jgi:hypothetical protein
MKTLYVLIPDCEVIPKAGGTEPSLEASAPLASSFFVKNRMSK